MTNTTVAPATRIYTIPATGLEHAAGDVTIVCFPHPQAGYRIHGRRNGVTDPALCSTHSYEYDALREWNALVALHPAAVEPAAPKLTPATKGTQTKVSDPQHTALAIAVTCGHIERGGKPGQAAVTVLKALAKRGYLDLTYSPTSRFTVTGADITGPGRTRLAQLTAADRELADFTARLQASLTFDTKPANAPVAA
jgi:hypothetical protein